jgi:hypothetical protein
MNSVFSHRAASLTLSVLVSACVASADDPPSPAPESSTAAWETNSVEDAEESTHLFLVENAVRILEKHPEIPEAKRVLEVMSMPRCKPSWQRGLYDADFAAEYNDGLSRLPANPKFRDIVRSLTTWQSHFYDPDSGKNYLGRTYPTALSRGSDAVTLMLSNDLHRGYENGCFHLGVALHFMTDLTQPMHAANFTAMSRPIRLHVNMEAFALERQSAHVLPDWSTRPEVVPVRGLLLDVARRSKARWPVTYGAVARAYARAEQQHRFPCKHLVAWGAYLEGQNLDVRGCWDADPEVDAAVGDALERAQEETAGFLVAVGGELLRIDAMVPEHP